MLFTMFSDHDLCTGSFPGGPQFVRPIDIRKIVRTIGLEWALTLHLILGKSIIR